MSDTSKKVECARHGISHAAFICGHLPGAVGAGFFFSDPGGDPRPDAWCARCDEVLSAEGQWNEPGEKFAAVTFCCAGCYDELRARNAFGPEETGADTFVCASCDEVHQGLPRDFAYPAPFMSPEEHRRAQLAEDTCVLDEHRYVRACLEIPVPGGPGPLVYGVWVSLSQKSFDEAMEHGDHPRRYLDGPYFGWLSTLLPGWPETLNLKTMVHVRPVGLRPVIELEPTDHPLAVAQREGISPERFRAIALELLHGVER